MFHLAINSYVGFVERILYAEDFEYRLSGGRFYDGST